MNFIQVETSVVGEMIGDDLLKCVDSMIVMC